MPKSTPADRDTAGPFDVSEIGVLTPYLDFGSIRLAPQTGHANSRRHRRYEQKGSCSDR